MRLTIIVCLAVALAGCDDEEHESRAPARARPEVKTPPASQPHSAAPATAPAAELALAGVTLFAGGTAQFVHEGTVADHAAITLNFKAAHVPGVVRSLTVQDDDPSAVVLVRTPSERATTRSSRLDLARNPTLAEMLQQLRGVAAKIVRSGETLDVTILGLEQKDKGWQLNVLCDGSIRSVSMDGVQRIELTDARARDELKRAVQALWNNDQDAQPLPVCIELRGAGQRRVRVSYILPVQPWTVNYRLSLGDRPHLQGWANITNDTDADWNNVQVILAGTQPVVLGASAALDSAALNRAAKASAVPPGEPLRERRPVPSRAAVDVQESPPPRLLWQEPPSAPLTDPDAFRYAVPQLAVPRKAAVVVPLLSAPIAAERLALYNESLLRRNALVGARLRNTTRQYLPRGPLTVLDGQNLAGETVLENLAPGRSCLVTWGIDLTMIVEASDESMSSTVAAGSIENGVLNLTRRHVSTRRYVAQNEQRDERLLVIEHSPRRGWTLVEPDELLDMTETVCRIGQVIPGGQKRTITVREQIDEAESIDLFSAEPDGLAALARIDTLSQPVRQALAKVLSAKNRIEEQQQRSSQLAARIDSLSAEQRRLSETLSTLPERSPARDRLQAKFEETEALIVELQRDLARSVSEAEKLRSELRQELSNLSADR